MSLKHAISRDLFDAIVAGEVTGEDIDLMVEIDGIVAGRDSSALPSARELARQCRVRASTAMKAIRLYIRFALPRAS